jgi:hypothetical protein
MPLISASGSGPAKPKGEIGGSESSGRKKRCEPCDVWPIVGMHLFEANPCFLGSVAQAAASIANSR